MSWLNFNESLNNIKGQLSSFASGVLAEGIAEEKGILAPMPSYNDDDTSSKNKNKDLEGQQNVQPHKLPQDAGPENGSSWNWVPPGGPPTVRNDRVLDMQSKIEMLENEKKDLIASLEQLDSDYQQTTDKLVTLKDNVQADYNELKVDFEKLQKEYGEVLKENMVKSRKIKTLLQDSDDGRRKSVQEENEVLTRRLSEAEGHSEVVQRLENLKKEFEQYKQSSEEEKVNADELKQLCKKLEDENARLCAQIHINETGNDQKSQFSSSEDVVQELEEKNLNLIRESEALSLQFQILTHENQELHKVNEKLKKDYEVLKTEGEKLAVAVEELQNYSEELKNSNRDIQDQLQTLQNTNYTLISNHKELKVNHEKLQSTLETVENNNEAIKKDYDQLKNEKDQISCSFEDLRITSEQLKRDLEKLRNTNFELKKEYENFRSEHEKLNEENLTNNDTTVPNLQTKYDNLKSIHDKVVKDKEALHERYISIITESMQKYVNCNTDVASPLPPNEDPQIVEFAGKVESLLRLLLDFKSKTEMLEKELCEVTQEKNKTISEKNFEIEKLLQNSEILSQEVITKTQAIKDYEEECAELMKNNDLLISELQNYKSSSGLQTISESNEDNMLLLESQLENANKRIQDLEIIITEMENSKQETNLETQTELDYIKKQLNMTGQELSQSKEEYQNLLAQYNQLEKEKCSVKSALDKIKLDYENTEYKYTEVNVTLETLKEENEEYKNKLGDVDISSQKLENLNFNLESKIELLQNVMDDLKQKLELEAQNTKEKELQIRNLVERLQNSKMCETGLKLQVDTIYKELQVVSEAKQSLEMKYNQSLSKLSELEEDLRKAKEDCSVLRTTQKLEKHFEEGDAAATKQEVAAGAAVEVALTRDELEKKLMMLNEEFSMTNSKINELQTQLETATQAKQMLQTECINVKNAFSQSSQKNMEFQQQISFLEAQFTDLSTSRNELITLVKAKHHENVKYHEEIQRLSHLLTEETEKASLLEAKLQGLSISPLPNDSSNVSAEELQRKNEEIEKLTDQNTFLREKCEVLAQNLLQEQSHLQKVLSERLSVSDKEQALSKELERLRAHLVEIEEMYTQELLQAEQKNKEMQAKVNEIEQREKDSSSIYTSVSIRANQQVETLQTQLQLVTNQRDDLRMKISNIEDENNKHIAALTNLQLVLEQFQKDKEKDVYQETERVRRQITAERQIQRELQGDINNLKMQLEESKQGLQAAARLTDQLEKCKQQVVGLKDEVAKLQDQLKTSEAKYKDLSTHTDVKVDKTLIKNLVIGYITSSTNDQNQILKIIATVLDFNQKESDRVNLNRPQQGGWLSSILHPQSLNSNQEMSQQSLSEAFVRFLENESKPKVLPNLLSSNQRKMSEGNGSSSSSTPRQSPLVLSEVMLPTFADFGKNRNSSSILKDVLKDNT